MMFGSKKKSSGSCSIECTIMKAIVAFLYLLCTVAAAIGVYLAHVFKDGFSFGTMAGSLSLIAFVFCISKLKCHLTCWMKPCDVCTTSKK